MINSAKLKGAIYAAGYTMKTLAETAGIDYTLFTRKVAGKSPFSAKQMLIVCDLLHLTQEEARDIFLPSDFTDCKVGFAERKELA